MKSAHSRGFTLIEIIGVLAIISILASAITPNIIHEIKRATMEAEDRSLDTFTDALKRSIGDNRLIPGTTSGSWDGAIAPYLDIPANTVLINRAANARRLVSRPANDLGGVPYDQQARFSGGPLPQGTLPTLPPLQARLLLVSNLRTAVGNQAISNVQFDAIWNQTGTIPNGFSETIDVRIGRCALASLFYPVTINCTAVLNVPRWTLDSAPVKSLAAGSFTVYLIAGTRVTIFTGAVAQGTVVVDRPRGISFDGSNWSL